MSTVCISEAQTAMPKSSHLAKSRKAPVLWQRWLRLTLAEVNPLEVKAGAKDEVGAVLPLEKRQTKHHQARLVEAEQEARLMPAEIHLAAAEGEAEAEVHQVLRRHMLETNRTRIQQATMGVAAAASSLSSGARMLILCWLLRTPS